MVTKDNGGPAFPSPSVTLPDGVVIYGEFGMSLRDYFAAKAIAACPLHQINDKAQWAYRMADAMLKARQV